MAARPTPWYALHPGDDDGCRAYKQGAPFDNIWIGTDPLDGMTIETARSFDAIVNVSDSPCAHFEPARPDQRMYWYPVNEAGYWGYGVFYYIKKVLDYHYDRGHKIYLHCHAGAHRSPTMFIWWLVSRGYTLEEAVAFEWKGNCKPETIAELKKESLWQHRLYNDVKQGHVPQYLPKLYESMRQHPTWSLGGHLLHGRNFLDKSYEVLCAGDRKNIRRMRIKRPYYWVKGRCQDLVRWVKLYRQGEILIRVIQDSDDGEFTYRQSMNRAEWKRLGKPKFIKKDKRS